ncbi:hypothetical protein [Streptomyces chryseus]|uniref:hypothetical protein n=1 Tax=Streptomyces chryseus TaxID=68186 RepID=UPI00110FA2AE|nr:hypothetical protein [Streptomyces chryseus]GGX02009.1 hypothetical protein GCM10010353_17050 [Streptomyces chryseus]
MDIVTVEHADTRPPRDTGTYLTQYTGRITWPDPTNADATWQAQGVRLALMDGRRTLTTCTLECKPADADDVTARAAATIAPWARTLRFLDALRSLRHSIDDVERLRHEAYQWEGADPPAEVSDRILAYATGDEVDTARAAHPDGLYDVRLTGLILKRLGTQSEAAQRAALAYAPDVHDSPLPRSWEQPSHVRGSSGEETAQFVARELLAAWALIRDMRDPLATWAVGVGLPKTAVQQTSGMSRSTIDRLLS